MSDEELVEALVARLGVVFEQALDDQGRRATGITPFDLSPVARECLRQMEWAYQSGLVFGLHGESDPRDYTIKPQPSLTLAPEDWKP